MIRNILSGLCLAAVLTFGTSAAQANSFTFFDDEGDPTTTATTSLDNICFHDVTSYDQVRSQLPGSLQNPPVYAVHQSWDLTGGIRILPQGNNIWLDAHIKSTFAGVINQTAIIVTACLNGDSLQVTLNNGKSQTIQVNDNSLTIKGYDFNLTDAGTYQKVVSAVPNQ